jgi:hypothetical protein
LILGLVEAGADLTVQNVEGLCPLDMASPSTRQALAGLTLQSAQIPKIIHPVSMEKKMPFVSFKKEFYADSFRFVEGKIQDDDYFGRPFKRPVPLFA